MKQLFISLLLILSGITASAQNDQFVLRVEGLGCVFCAYGLDDKLQTIEGISDLQIDIETGKVSFAVPVATALTLAGAEEKVVESGYTPRAVKVTRASGEVEEKGDISQTIAPIAMKEKKAKMKVAGSCGMCKARIEQTALSVEGVSKAVWNASKGELALKYNPLKTNLALIQDAIVKAGHDTDVAKADDKTYENLPGCCHYR